MAACGTSSRPDREARAAASRFALPPDLPAAYAWSALLVRRESLASLDWDGIGGRGETLEFFRIARERLRLGAVPGIVYERRIHGDNLTVVDRDAIQADYLRVAREAILAHRRSS